MANNNVQNVRFLRNGTPYRDRATALDELKSQNLSTEQDGSLILARYGSGDNVKTLVGVVYAKGSNKSITIIDIEGASGDVEKLKQEINAKLGEGITSENTATEQLAALSGTSDDASGVTSVNGAKKYAYDLISTLDHEDTAVSGEYVSQVTEANGIIAVTRVALPSLTEVKETGKPIIAVSEDKGQVAASAGAINAEFVNIADGDGKFTATTVEDALAEIATEIDAMDLEVVSGNGEVITAVSEDDGKVSASKTAIKDVKLTGYVKNTTATGAISGNDDIEDALSKLENTISSNEITNADGSITVTPANGSTTDVKVHIKEGEKVIKLDANKGGIYTDIKIASATPTSTTVKEEYNLLDSDGNALGASIKIYKDSHIVSITYITDSGDTKHYQNLEYKYIDANGDEQTEYVDISSLVLEAEFQSGVTATDHVVHGVVDSTSEKDSSNNSFLTVGADGFKVNGIKGEITTKINALNATVSGESADNKVNVKVTETNGVITAVDVVGTDIASATALAKEISDRTDADTALSNRLGDNVTAANTASAQLSALSGASEDASGVTSVNGAKKYAQQYADEKVATIVASLDATVSGETADGKVNVKVTEEDGVITAVNVVGTDIASASALTAEILARKAVDGQEGQIYAANANANYISRATSLNDADVKLDAALKTADDAMLTSVTAGNGISVSTKSDKSQTISAKVNGDGGIVNDDANGLHLGTIDCGTY